MSEMQIMTADELDRELATRRETNPALVYLASLESAASRRTMRGALNAIAALLAPGATLETFPWHELRYGHVAALRSKLAETLSYKTVNKRLSAVRRVAREAWRLGLVDAETYQRVQDVSNLKGETIPAGRNVRPGEIAALMETCANDQTAAGVRDAAIIGVLYCGLRRAEAARLELTDYDQEAAFLTCAGKGNKQRRVPVVNGAGAALADWLGIRGDEPGPLFWAIRKGGHVQRGGGLSTQALYAMLQKRTEEAGMDAATPHDFRRTAVGDYLDAGVDIATVQRIMGHASPATTARYDRRPERAKSDAANRLHLPYTRRRTLDRFGA